jgi:hypothetical protein
VESWLGAGFDRQQADAGFPGGVVQQLGRAHGGAAGGGGQDALAVVGEEDRVDQLGFTAREFGDEGHRQAVVAHPRQPPAPRAAGRRVRTSQRRQRRAVASSAAAIDARQAPYS